LIFHVLTLFPEVFKGFLESSILGKAISAGTITVNLVNIRDFAIDKHRTCDDGTYGGGPGMVLKPEPLSRCIESIEWKGKTVVYPTPSGRLYNQDYASRLATLNELILICGKYEGIDQRIIDHYVTDEISIGDYVLNSGEIAAQVVIDSVVRLISGVITEESLDEESFRKGLLEYPHYTRPQEFMGMSVPEILISGHHKKIQEWRFRMSLAKTLRMRPDLIEKLQLVPEEKKILEEIKAKGEYDGSC
jgi:tRNA (guanine37-N1)-methyltransferase